MKTDSLSVFFPCINEEGNIENIVKRAEGFLKKLKLKYEIIIVDDGSTDATGKIAERFAQVNSNIRVIHHPKNLGYGEALKSGFYNAKYETIVYTDGDGQFDFSEITKFLEKIDDYDLVVGYRIKRQDPLFRILFKKGWKLSLWAFFGLTLKDVDCGFKMIKKRVLEKIPHLESQRGAMINAELAIKAKRCGFKIAQVGVNHYPRTSGKPTGASLNVIIKSYMDLMKLWWKLKSQKILFIGLMLIMVLAIFLRFYNLSGYMTFLGDEGRDAIVVRDMFLDHHFPLIGPPTSVGNIYLGPLYYYMMAFSMFIFYLNPVAAAGMNALIGVLIVVLIYYLAKEWFGRIPALVSALLYSVSPVNIIYSRSSWNPNPTPFFALLAILGIQKSRKNKDYRWLILTGASLAAALQMHYLALILLPIAAIFWIKELFSKENKYFWQGTIIGILVFIILMSPLVLFDLKHNFLNYRAISSLFFDKQTPVNINLFETLNSIPNIYIFNLIGRYITVENKILTIFVSILVLIPIFMTGFLIYKNKQFNFGVWLLNNWLLIGILGLSLYKGEIYDHYLGFLNPAPYFLFGSLFMFFKNKPIKWALSILVIVLTIINLQKTALLRPPNNQLMRTQQIAKFVIREARGQDFNFALLVKNNYDSAYQFYLDQYGHKPKQVPFDKTDQLFVVCEDLTCDPTHSPKYELAAFGWSKVSWMKEFEDVKIYKLVPNPSGKP